MWLRTAESRLCSFKQRPSVNVQPRRPFENGLRTNCPQAVAFFVFGSRCKQLPQPPDRGVHRAAPPLGIKLRPEQVDKPLATMRAIRKGEKETSQSPSRWAEVRPDLFATTRKLDWRRENQRSTRFPLPREHNENKKCRFWLFSHSSLELQLYPIPPICSASTTQPKAMLASRIARAYNNPSGIVVTK
jgi:hypothetical protein